MRISDWSSDVCSSDLADDTFYLWTATAGLRWKFGSDPNDDDGDGVPNSRDKCPGTPKGVTVYSDGCPTDLDGDGVPDYLDKCPNTPKGTQVGPRSEEHTSELQSLMRSSYAVFCLKKNKNTSTPHTKITSR